MVWFFVFTSMGVAIALFLLIMKWAARPGWRDWVSNIALLSVLAWLSRA